MSENINFSEAIEAVLSGKKAARKGWPNGRHIERKAQNAALPERISFCDDGGHPLGTMWAPGQAEMLADDWFVLE